MSYTKQGVAAHLAVVGEDPERIEEEEGERNVVGEEDLAVADVHGAETIQRGTVRTARRGSSEQGAGSWIRAHGFDLRWTATNSAILTVGGAEQRKLWRNMAAAALGPEGENGEP